MARGAPLLLGAEAPELGCLLFAFDGEIDLATRRAFVGRGAISVLVTQRQAGGNAGACGTLHGVVRIGGVLHAAVAWSRPGLAVFRTITFGLDRAGSCGAVGHTDSAAGLLRCGGPHAATILRSIALAQHACIDVSSGSATRRPLTGDNVLAAVAEQITAASTLDLTARGLAAGVACVGLVSRIRHCGVLASITGIRVRRCVVETGVQVIVAVSVAVAVAVAVAIAVSVALFVAIA